MKTRLATAAFVLLLSGCALFQAGRDLKSCRYAYQGFGFASVDAEKTYWNIGINVANPNAKPVTLEKMRFALLHQEDTLVSGWNPSRQEIAAGDSLDLTSTLEIPHAILQRFPPSLLADPKARFTLVGDAYLNTWLGEMQVPGAFRQTLYINMPEQVAKVRTIFMQKLFPGYGRPKPSAAPAPDL